MMRTRWGLLLGLGLMASLGLMQAQAQSQSQAQPHAHPQAPRPWMDRDTPTLMQEAADWSAQGRFRRAERRYRQVLTREPGNRQAQLGLASALHAQGEWQEALGILEGLVQQAGSTCAPADCQPAFYLLGVIYEAQGDNVRARDAFQQYVTISPGTVAPDPALRIKLRRMGIF